jgi:hypothetical protein
MAGHSALRVDHALATAERFSQWPATPLRSEKVTHPAALSVTHVLHGCIVVRELVNCSLLATLSLQLQLELRQTCEPRALQHAANIANRCVNTPDVTALRSACGLMLCR